MDEDTYTHTQKAAQFWPQDWESGSWANCIKSGCRAPAAAAAAATYSRFRWEISIGTLLHFGLCAIGPLVNWASVRRSISFLQSFLLCFDLLQKHKENCTLWTHAG